MNNVVNLIQFDVNCDEILDAINKTQIAQKYDFNNKHADSDFVFLHFLKVKKGQIITVF